MTATWLELQHPLDPCLDRLLRDLDEHLRWRNIPYLLAGGMAREILLHHGHGCARGRATNDVDFGVTLSDWGAYEALRHGLTDSGRFRPDPKEAQRIIHRDLVTGMETKVDLVPFGAIAAPSGKIGWPPDGSHVMRILGYSQALAMAIHLRLDETHWVPLASASGLAMMKLVTWVDRGEARLGRDAVDFLEIARQHAHLLTDKELYDDFPEAMERYSFRPEPAAAWILGKQVAALADDRLREVVLCAILRDSALIMIDCQNTYREGIMQLTGVEEALLEARKLLGMARELKIPVFHIRHDAGEGTPYDVKAEIGAIAREVAPLPGEPVITKNYPNAFFRTDLDQRLRGIGIHNLVLAGFMTHMCVNSTAHGGFELGYAPTVVASATASRPLQADRGKVLTAQDVHEAALASTRDLYAAIVDRPEAFRSI